MLKRTMMLAAAAALLCAQAAFVHAADRTNLIVMVDDSGRGSVSSRNPVYAQVVNAVQNHLFYRGYRVFDAAVVFRNQPRAFRWRKNSGELLQLARLASDYPLDILVVLEIYASGRSGGGGSLDDFGGGSGARSGGVRVAGRLIEIRTGRSLGNFESEGGASWSSFERCGRPCTLDNFGRHAAAVGRDVAEALVVKLESYGAPGERKPWIRDEATDDGKGDDSADKDDGKDAGGKDAGGKDDGGKDVGGKDDGSKDDGGKVTFKPCGGTSSAYVLEFENFSRPEMSYIVKDLSGFHCYDRHRVLRESAAATAFWYESTAGTDRLLENLKLMLDYMGVTARFESKDRTITVRREIPN